MSEIEQQEKPTIVTVDDALLLERADFYRKSYDRTFKLFVASLAGNAALAITIVVFLLNPVQPKYFTTEKGMITPIIPIDQPLARESDVVGWASKAISNVNTFSFSNIREVLASAKDDFTDQGFSAYIKGLKASGNDTMIMENKYTVTVVPKETPIITAAALIEGVYFYRINYEMLITYENLKGRKTKNAKVEAMLRRVPGYINPSNLQIHSLKITGA